MASKSGPEPPKEAQERPKRRPGQSKRGQERPRAGQKRPKSHPEKPQKLTGAARDVPGGAGRRPERLPGCENRQFLLGFRAS